MQDEDGDEVIDELVEYYVLLISLTDFLEVSNRDNLLRVFFITAS